MGTAQTLLESGIIVCAITISLGLLVFFAQIAWALIKIGRLRYSELNRIGSIKQVVTGTVPSRKDDLQDPRIMEGMYYDKKLESFVPNGFVSDDYIKGLLKI